MDKQCCVFRNRTTDGNTTVSNYILPTPTTYSKSIYQQKIALTEFYLTLSRIEIIHNILPK